MLTPEELVRSAAAVAGEYAGAEAAADERLLKVVLTVSSPSPPPLGEAFRLCSCCMHHCSYWSRMLTPAAGVGIDGVAPEPNEDDDDEEEEPIPLPAPPPLP